MAELNSIFVVDDRVLIMDGELTGCTGKVTVVAEGGLLVVKPDQPDEHPPIVIPDADVLLRDIAPGTNPSP